MLETRDIPLQSGVFMNRRGFISDPQNGVKGYLWITVGLPPEMTRDSHSDDEIVSYMIHMIGARDFLIGDRALHCMGARCISLPVKGFHREEEDEITAYAELLAMWWLAKIRQGRVRINQYGVFEAAVPCPWHINSLWRVPHGKWPSPY